MKISINKAVGAAVGAAILNEFTLTDVMRYYDHNDRLEISLRCGKGNALERLEAALVTHQSVRGAGVLLKDVRAWRSLMNGSDGTKARTVEHFNSILTEVLRRLKGHRVYKQDIGRGAWLPYYVEEVEYVPERRERDYRHDEFVRMELWWEEFDERHSDRVTFLAHECAGMTVSQALALKGFALETPDLRTEYLKDLALYDATVNRIGVQFTAVGLGKDNLDGNKRLRDGWWASTGNSAIQLDRDGQPARVVIDIFREGKKENKSQHGLRVWFWSGSNRHDFDNDNDEITEIPRHTFLACFDLRRHLRVRIHVRQLTEYRYDPSLREKLVLPEDSRALVEMLLANTGVFRDIIGNKGNSSIVLCAGSPGTGKTLTAEVYSESTGRPLYSVQASQLGTDPGELEDELHKVFARAMRWNAILLIDEADVYVAARGASLVQNAIVGVLLRVLEYFRGVMFLTTNRIDIVDDAVASRCIARLDYSVPPPDDQRRIWRILADTAGIALADATIDNVVRRYPHLSGRDVKNILKLSAMVAASRRVAVTEEVIEFAKRFKPTLCAEEAP